MTKIIYWCLYGRELVFRLNWFEFMVLKRVFKLNKYETHKIEIEGQKADLVVVDEAANIDFDKLQKVYLKKIGKRS